MEELRIIIELLGWDGEGKKSFRLVGDKYHMTHTRVEKIFSDFRMKVHSSKYDQYAMASVLVRVLAAFRQNRHLNDCEMELMLNIRDNK